MRKAFTLIELLVVVAIVAILAAILFPVFAQAKAAAKKTQCLSNVKQLGIGFALYEGDADDTLPNVTDGPQAGMVGGWMYYSVSGGAQLAVFDPSKGSLYPYVKNAGVFQCPVDAKAPQTRESYAISSCLVDPLRVPLSPAWSVPLRGRSMGFFPAPADTMLLGEEATWGGSFAAGTNDDAYIKLDQNGSNLVSTRHATGANGGASSVAYLDGHAKSVWFPNQVARIVGGVWLNAPQHDAMTGKGSVSDVDCGTGIGN